MWEKVGNCVPCEKCELPQGDANMNIRYIPGTFDAELTCVEGVIKPGSQESSMAISCIEGGNWNLDVPVCSRKCLILTVKGDKKCIRKEFIFATYFIKCPNT